MRKLAPLIVFLVVAASFITIQAWATSQTLNLDPGFGPALVAVRTAESAGATPTEIAGLVTLLNKALMLNCGASKLNETEARSNSTEIRQILITVDDQANQLATTSSQRTSNQRILAYASGVVIAIVGTLAFALLVPVYEAYQTRRTLRMRVRRT